MFIVKLVGNGNYAETRNTRSGNGCVASVTMKWDALYGCHLVVTYNRLRPLLFFEKNEAISVCSMLKSIFKRDNFIVKEYSVEDRILCKSSGLPDDK